VPDAPTRARAYFDELLDAKDKVAYIQSLCDPADPAVENDWREFKEHPGSGNEDKVKGIWAEALAGFANTEGGVLVWGVVAKETTLPDGTKVDAAHRVQRVADPRDLRAKLLKWQVSMTDPPVAGVEVLEIVDPNNSGEGFVACCVPESKVKPHRTDVKGSKQYIYRAGDSFRVLPTALLRDLFFPHRVVAFTVQGKMTVRVPADTRETRAEISFMVTIANTGSGSARDLCVAVGPLTTDLQPVEWMGGGWGRLPHLGGVTALLAAAPLHPGEERLLFNLRASSNVRSAAGGIVLPSALSPEMRFTFYSTDQPRQTASMQFDAKEAVTTGSSKREASSQEG
jgi:hypothetical protein